MNHIFRFFSVHRRAILLVIYVCLIAVLWYLPGVFHPKSVDDVRQWVTGFGVWGPAAYILLYTVRPLLLFPSLILNVAAGILFPPVTGIPCLTAGGLGSAILLFYMARSGIGSEFLDLHGGKWGSRIHHYLSDSTKNFQRMLWLRTVPDAFYNLYRYHAAGHTAGCGGLQCIRGCPGGEFRSCIFRVPADYCVWDPVGFLVFWRGKKSLKISGTERQVVF